VRGGVPAGQQAKPAQELAQGQVEQSQRHGADHRLPRVAGTKPQVSTMDEILGTHMPTVRPLPAGMHEAKCACRGVGYSARTAPDLTWRYLDP
jgi:hypothetical protein